MGEQKMMKCGCVSHSTCSKRDGVVYDPPVPSCIVHDCIEQAPAPDLTGRKARCSYYGKNAKYEKPCKCEKDSSLDLAFFGYRPDRTHDEFYCGCFGWD